ncbi:MAG TPA: superoxide dismutase family protein [Burkholderiales bacterium]|nr:superoxide dismutase family protein [Burkholderiales bacterium]
MRILLAAAGALCLTACAGMTPSSPSANTTLKPTQGNKAAGSVRFTQQGDKVRVVANVTGLTPGLHGFHIHTNGDCSAPDAMSAGGHFNPHGSHHGDVQAADRHAGDLGNLTADKDGNAKVDVAVEGLSLAADASNSVVGRAVVIHANPDDLKSQPAGNSGPRVACGVVAAAAAEAAPARPRY